MTDTIRQAVDLFLQENPVKGFEVMENLMNERAAMALDFAREQVAKDIFSEAVIKHDGFARQETHRDLVHSTAGCSNCGQTPKSGKLKQYSTSNDDRPGRKNAHKGLFCSKGCHDSYHS